MLRTNSPMSVSDPAASVIEAPLPSNSRDVNLGIPANARLINHRGEFALVEMEGREVLLKRTAGVWILHG